MMPDLPEDIADSVARALAEDIGTGDVTAGLLDQNPIVQAAIQVNTDAVLCGVAWCTQTFLQLDEDIKLIWHAADGESIRKGQVICQLSGPSHPILSGERTALNFLQTLSGTATTTAMFVKIIEGLDTKLLDTRKTIPGLRRAQKYAVSCAGGVNHRMGLYDAILIKENHIAAAGSIEAAFSATRGQKLPVEIEVENLSQLRQALAAGCERILLDNFDLASMQEAVKITAGRATLEASGGITAVNLRSIAETGVDYISIGALTKHIQAIDFSLRLTGDL